MKFLKKYILSFEVGISISLVILVLLSHLSYTSMFDSFGSEVITIRDFDTLWLKLYWPNFLVYFYEGLGFLINLLFYSFFLFFPIFGLIHKRNKKHYFIIHIFFLVVILIHFLAFLKFYYTYSAIAGV